MPDSHDDSNDLDFTPALPESLAKLFGDNGIEAQPMNPLDAPPALRELLGSILKDQPDVDFGVVSIADGSNALAKLLADPDSNVEIDLRGEGGAKLEGVDIMDALRSFLGKQDRHEPDVYCLFGHEQLPETVAGWSEEQQIADLDASGYPGRALWESRVAILQQVRTVVGEDLWPGFLAGVHWAATDALRFTASRMKDRDYDPRDSLTDAATLHGLQAMIAAREIVPVFYANRDQDGAK